MGERIMAIGCIRVSSASDEVVVAAAGVADSAALCVECFEMADAAAGVVVGTAEGAIAVYRLRASGGDMELQLVLQVSLHDAGVNDLAIRRQGDGSFLLATAGDDQRLVL